MVEWNSNASALLGAAAGAAIAIPAAVAVAPLAMGSLGVFGGAVALTALGAGVIGITSVIGNHIGEVIEAHNSHETIKKILDDKEMTNNQKIDKITRIAETKADNGFLRLFGPSEKIGYMYVGALNPKAEQEGAEQEDQTIKDEKIIKGLKVVNKLDSFPKEHVSEFLSGLERNKWYEGNEANLPYIFGQKITEHSEEFFDEYDLKTDITDVKNFFNVLEAIPDGPAPAPDPAPATVLAPANAGAGGNHFTNFFNQITYSLNAGAAAGRTAGADAGRTAGADAGRTAGGDAGARFPRLSQLS